MGFASVLVLTLLVGPVVSAWLMVVSSLLGATAIATYLVVTNRRWLRTIGDAGRSSG